MTADKETMTESSASSSPQMSKINISIKPNYTQNINVDIIAISEEKLRLNIINYENSIKSRQNWHTPLGIFVTIVIAFCTTDFKPISDNITTDHVKQFFTALFGANFLWLIYAIYKCITTDKSISTLDKFIEVCKHSEKNKK